MTDIDKLLLDLKNAITENIIASQREDEAKVAKTKAHYNLQIAKQNLADFTRQFNTM
jgi:hypothetical protein